MCFKFLSLFRDNLNLVPFPPHGQKVVLLSVADQEFPRRGAPTYDFAKISPKLHEIERIWTPRVGSRPKFYYVDPPLIVSDILRTNRIELFQHL